MSNLANLMGSNPTAATGAYASQSAIQSAQNNNQLVGNMLAMVNGVPYFNDTPNGAIMPIVKKLPPYRVINFYGTLLANTAGNSEQLPTKNLATGLPVTYNFSPGQAPFGIKTGQQTSSGATGGVCQANLTVPADTNWYIYSFIAYAPAGVTGATFLINQLGFNGGDMIYSLGYNFDTPLSSTGSPFNTNYTYSTGKQLHKSTVIQDLGGGFYRFSRPFKNNGQNTFIIKFLSSVSNDLSIITGHQLEQYIPGQSNPSLLPSVYSPAGKPSPYLSQGRDGIIVSDVWEYRFQNAVAFSDSIWVTALSGGGYMVLANYLEWMFGYSATDGIGGTLLVDNNVVAGVPQRSVLNRMSDFGISNLSQSLVIINGGRNDVGNLINTTPTYLLNALIAAVNSLGHNNYVIMGVLSGYTGSEDTGLGNRPYTDAYNAMLKSTFGNRFFDTQAASMAGYDPTKSTDVTAVANGRRPPSLTANGDGIHMEAAETMVVGDAFLRFIQENY